jgi:hypothetical protein
MVIILCVGDLKVRFFLIFINFMFAFTNKHKMLFNNTVITSMMKFLMLVKYYHWSTDSYNRHVISDGFYTNINVLIDRFVETYQGIAETVVPMGVKVDISFESYTDQTFVSRLQMFLDYLIRIRKDMTHSELLNIMDELSAEIQKTIYLSRFN